MVKRLMITGLLILLFASILTGCKTDIQQSKEPLKLKLISEGMLDIYVSDETKSKSVILTNLDGYFKYIPESLKDLLSNNNYKLIVLKSFENVDVPDLEKHINSVGFHYRDKKEIYLKTRDNSDADYLASVLLHELGHAYDWGNEEKMRFSITHEFKAIFKEEYSKMFNLEKFLDKEAQIKHLNDPSEYFAQCFAEYMLSGTNIEGLKKNAPKTYEYIKKVCKN